MARVTGPPGLREAEILRAQTALKMVTRWEEIQDKERGCATNNGPPGMAKDSFPWTHGNGITLVTQLPQK